MSQAEALRTERAQLHELASLIDSVLGSSSTAGGAAVPSPTARNKTRLLQLGESWFLVKKLALGMLTV
jgi:hypothetical protein